MLQSHTTDQPTSSQGKHIAHSCADLEGVQGVQTPLKNYKNIGFLSNTGRDPLKNHKAAKPAFNVGPSLARQGNAINGVSLAANDDPLLVLFGTFFPLSKKKLDPL